MGALPNVYSGKVGRLVILRELVVAGKICADIPVLTGCGKTDAERVSPLRVVSLDAGEVVEA